MGTSSSLVGIQERQGRQTTSSKTAKSLVRAVYSDARSSKLIEDAEATKENGRLGERACAKPIQLLISRLRYWSRQNTGISGGTSPTLFLA